MRRLNCGALWAYAAATLVACDDNFVPYNQVEGTRILGIAAEPAELWPGREARLSALVTEARGYRWSWCPLTLGPGAGHACALEEHLISTASTAVITWPGDLGALCEAAARTSAPQDGLRLDCRAERPALAIRLVVEAEEGSVSALWPLVLGQGAGSAHQNPRLQSVSIEGTPLEDGAAFGPGQRLPLTALTASTSIEAEEALRITWFVTAGEVDRARTAIGPGGDPITLGTNTWTLPTEAGPAALHLVIRDDRGGVSWLSRQIHVAGGAP